MGMDMVTKGVHNVIEFLSDDSPDMDVIGISDNFFSDINKPAAVNCIEGHGSSLGRFKSHASNIMFDVFIATCQDPAQNMESSQIDGSNHRTITISTITEDTIIENQGLAASSGLSVLGDKVDEECAAANPPEISDAQNNRKCCRE
ncbi:hypothetical protein F2Q68_00010663 [Brassica cretica]|uniref:Uncharacterized protein n=1 Tax=Brassica cretica TaxID=69181 RepID=A0A8S9L3Y0_BRACR|nr:hypothetical protein F2Q68_00010663 [Brassica cretica]